MGVAARRRGRQDIRRPNKCQWAIRVVPQVVHQAMVMGKLQQARCPVMQRGLQATPEHRQVMLECPGGHQVILECQVMGKLLQAMGSKAWLLQGMGSQDKWGSQGRGLPVIRDSRGLLATRGSLGYTPGPQGCSRACMRSLHTGWVCRSILGQG